MYKIGFVEDEKNLANLVVKYLKNEGYEVFWFITGEEALKNNNKIDLWILDIMLPGVINGYDLIKSIKEKNKKTPVIFTSARDQDIDKIMGLELGSDDYVAKPYSIRELVLRVKNLLNRTYLYTFNTTNEKQMVNGYSVDKDGRNVFEGEIQISLTSKEFDLLLYLVDNPGTALSRNQIIEQLWGSGYYGSDRVVDDLMRRIRQKLPNLNVETIYAYGYRLLV